MSLNTLYEDLLFLGGYVTDPHVFDKGPLPNGDRVTYQLVGDKEVVTKTSKREPAKAA